MLKMIGFGLLWLTGSALAIAVAWAGVSVVDDDLIEPAPATDQLGLGLPTDPNPGRSPVLDLEAPAESNSDPLNTPEPGSLAEAFEAYAEASANRSAGPGVTGTFTTPPSAPPTGPTSSTIGPTATATAPGRPSGSETATDQRSIEPDSTVTVDRRGSASTQASAAQTPTSTIAPTTAPTTSPTTAAPTTQTTRPTTAPAQTLTFKLTGGTTAISFSASEVKVLWATPNPGFSVEIEPESPGLKVEFEADHHRSRVDAWWDGGPRHEIRERPD